MIKNFIVYVLLVGMCSSCNNIPEAIMMANTDRIDTIDFHDYKYVVDAKNRRGYVTIDNDVMDGHYVIKRNDMMVEELFIEGGFINGERILYYENGRPERIENYKISVQHGPVTTFYKNGAVQSESSFTNGTPSIEEINYSQEGGIDSKTVVTEGVTYQHMYRDGNRMFSMFAKTIEEKRFDFIMKYDTFGTVQLVLGKLADDNSPIVYIFDANLNEVDQFNGQEEPLKAQEYMALFQSW